VATTLFDSFRRQTPSNFNSLLGLDPTVRLLDVGAGSGWPALYLAKISGCDVTMSDIPKVAPLVAGSTDIYATNFQRLYASRNTTSTGSATRGETASTDIYFTNFQRRYF
jgi:protein-L-isoaspartate O-methyltransferase